MRNRTVRPLLDKLPGHFRSEDSEHDRVLEALMLLLGEELQIVERNVDQLYDNLFVETAESWALPYIAQLVAASPMRDIGAGSAGLRAYIADVVQLRQAKGTAAATEQVATAVSGWAIVAVEFFKRLATSQNINHLRTDIPVFASVRNSALAVIAHTPFEKAMHSPAAGPVSGISGRYNIPNIGLFIWRQNAHFIGFLSNETDGYLGAPLASRSTSGGGLRHFDRLGRNLPLVNRPLADTTVEQRMSERHIPDYLDRNKLHQDLNALRDDVRSAGLWFKQLPVVRVRVGGVTIAPKQMHCCNLELAGDGSWRRPKNSGEILFDPVLGRVSLHANDQNKRVELECATAQAFDCGGGSYDRSASIESWQSDFFAEGGRDPWRIGVSLRAQEQTDNVDAGGPVVATLDEAIARWNVHAKAGDNGIVTVMDSASYNVNLTGNDKIFIPVGASLAIVAAGWPQQDMGAGAVQRTSDGLQAMNRFPHLKGDIEILGRKSGDKTGGSLILDGLLIEGDVVLSAPGNLDHISLNHCTVGAELGLLAGGLRVTGGNRSLSCTINSTIIGALNLQSASGGLLINDSIVGEDTEAGEAPDDMALVVDSTSADAVIARSTVFGQVRTRTIAAENSLFLGLVDVARKQKGCVRFCYVPLESQVPRRYKCAPDTSLDKEATRRGRPLSQREHAAVLYKITPVFINRQFAKPAFSLLSLRSSSAISSGAEDGLEMGVAYQLRYPARLANLHDAMQEFLPFGLMAGPIFIN